MKKGTAVLLFVIGAAIGAGVTWKVTRTKYKAIADEEIASVKKAYHTANEINISNTVTSNEVVKATDVGEKVKCKVSKDELEKQEIVRKEYVNIVTESGYSGKKPKTDEDYPRPYVISPDEFAGDYEFDTVDITYFADGVLCDENDVPLEDIENTIGTDAVRHFGEYENDAVYVRNERLKCDYEILRDERKYADLKRNRPKEE